MTMRNSPLSSLGFSLIIKDYDRITQQLSADRKIIPTQPVVVELWVSDVGLPFFIRSDCVFKKMLDCISSKGRIAFKHMARLNIILSHQRRSPGLNSGFEDSKKSSRTSEGPQPQSRT